MGKSEKKRKVRRRRATRRLRVEPLECRALLASWPGTVIHDNLGNIFTVDLEGGMALHYVGNEGVPAGGEMLDMAFSPEGALYGVNSPWWGPSELYEFDIDFNSPSPVITPHWRGFLQTSEGLGVYVNSLEFNSGGELYAAGWDGNGESWLFKINPDTAGVTKVEDLVVGGVAYGSAGDLAFDIDGNLYLTTLSGQLLELPPDKNSVEVVGQTLFGDFYGLTFGPAPLMYGFRQADEVYRIDPATGQSTLVATLSDPQLSLVNGAATLFPPPTDLGEVDFRELSNQTTTLGELWYRIEPVRDAILTVDTPNVDSGYDVDVTLYHFDTQGDLVPLDSGTSRADYENAVAGGEYFAKIEGAPATVDVRVTNLFDLSGNGAVVYGTDEDDAFEFVPGPPYIVSINGVDYSYNFDSNSRVVISFDGGIGHDSADITGSRLNDVATMSLATFSGKVENTRPAYRVLFSGTPEMTFHGAGGSDSATLTGSGFADTILLQPQTASVFGPNSVLRVTEVAAIAVDGKGASDTATFTGTTANETAELRYLGATFARSGVFSTTVANVETISAIGGGGYDTATFLDSPQTDTFQAGPTWATLTDAGSSFSLSATGYDEVHAQGGHGAGDMAVLFDDPNGLDYYTGRSRSADLSGNGFLIEALSFPSVVAYATAGNGDVALLYGDASQKEMFRAYPNQAQFYGADYSHRVESFKYIYAYANPGSSDVAVLLDAPGGQDTFKAWPGEAWLYGDGYRNRAYSFPIVYAISTQGDSDAALLYDAPGAADLFRASPTEARLYGNGYDNRALSFRVAYAYATPGQNDMAVLLDNPSQADNFRAWPTEARLYGESYQNRAYSFRVVYAFATPGQNDVALLYDDPGAQDTLRASPTQARLYTDTYDNRANSFRYAYAYSSPGQNDVAVLLDNPSQADNFRAWPTEARLYGESYQNRAYSFHSVYALATPGQADVALLYDDPTGADTFKAWPDLARLYDGSFDNRAYSFRYAYAYATPGHDDMAFFYDKPGAVDTFTAWPSEARQDGAGYRNRAVAFRYVYATSTPGDSDVAILYDDPAGQDTFEAWPDLAQLGGTGYFNRVSSFRYVHALGSRSGNDQAILHDSALADYLQVADNRARLTTSGVGYYLRCIDFDHVTAISTTPAGDYKQVDPHDFVLELLGYWQDL